MMKIAFFVALVVASLVVIPSEARHRYFRDEKFAGQDYSAVRDPVFQFFDARNDHFNKQDLSTYKERYVVNESFWRGNGYPIFVMLGGEGPLSQNELAGRFIPNVYANKYGALLVAIEHRFYGNSIPGDGTLKTENLKLLSADQALADYATFISFITKKYNAPDSKVVTFGGSYSGSLSAWMRQKYPDRVHAALASSAPVHAQLDFPEYHKVVTASVGPECAARIKSAFNKVEELMKTGDGKKQVMKDFAACDSMDSDLDEVTFLEALSDSVAGVIQYSGDNNALGRSWTVDRMCDLLSTGDDAYSAYVSFARTFRESQGETCTDSNYEASLAELRNTDPTNPAASGRSWTYQTCGEYGYYQTVESDDVPFSKRITLQYFLNMCKDVYGIDPSLPAKSVDYTNDYYGSRDVRGSRIVFTNGSVDPWHALGLISDTRTPKDMPVHYIQGTAHCADLYAPSKDDLPGLTAAREATWRELDYFLKQTL